MKRWLVLAILLGTLRAGAGASAAGTKDALMVDSDKADFKEVAPGVSKAVLWGDPEKGPYGGFTRFKPGQKNGLLTHTNDLRLLVIKGAYIYRPEKGVERRIRPGQYLFVPGGDRHVSSRDAKRGRPLLRGVTGEVRYQHGQAAGHRGPAAGLP